MFAVCWLFHRCYNDHRVPSYLYVGLSASHLICTILKAMLVLTLCIPGITQSYQKRIFTNCKMVDTFMLRNSSSYTVCIGTTEAFVQMMDASDWSECLAKGLW